MGLTSWFAKRETKKILDGIVKGVVEWLKENGIMPQESKPTEVSTTTQAHDTENVITSEDVRNRTIEVKKKAEDVLSRRG